VSVVPLAEFKEQLNASAIGSAGDDELQRTLDAAEQHVIRLCGPLAGGTSVEAYLSGDQLVLPMTRLAAAPTVTDPDGRAVVLAARDVNLLSGIIRVPYRRSGPWTVAVTSSAEVPADLRLAVLIIAAHLWETQRVPGAGQGGGQGFGQQSAAARPGAAWAVPNRAATLMGPYLLPTIA
jgi:hypothetical protein